MNKRENLNTSENVPVKPSETQYNRYNMTLPQSFSVYNNEGSVIYRGEVEQIASQLRAEVLGYGNGVPAEPVAEPVAPVRGYTKKRSFFLIVPLILTAVIIAIAVVGLLKTSINEYVALYGYEFAVQKDIGLLDPLFSFLKSSFKIELGTLPTEFATITKPAEDGNVVGIIAKYALPISIALYVVFTIISLVVSIAGLAGRKREDGTYAKAKLGFLSIVMFLCALIIAIGGIYVAGGKIGDVVPFLTGAGTLYAGYGFFALLAIPVVNFICTCCAYGKNRA